MRDLAEVGPFEPDLVTPGQSNSRVPSPSSTGTTIDQHLVEVDRPRELPRGTSAPITLTYLSPAAALDSATAVSRSVTKVMPSTGSSGG